MAFKIEPFGGAQYRGQYADHGDIRQYFGLSKYGKMPMDFEHEGKGLPLVGGGTVVVEVEKGNPSPTGNWRGKSSKHRCYAYCPDCSARVPVGRAHQHKCKG
jgi:hypothetical protein